VKHVILLFYIFSFTAGVSSLLLSLFIYFRHKIETIRYFIFFSLILGINAWMLMLSRYAACLNPAGAAILFPVLFKCSLILSAGLILYPVFTLIVSSCRSRVSNLKKVLTGLAVILTPNLVFSSTNIRNQIIDKINLADSSRGILIILCSAILVYMLIFVISGKKETGSIKKNQLLTTLTVSSYSLLIFILLDYAGFQPRIGTGDPLGHISFTIAAYFLVSVSFLVFYFRHYVNRAKTAFVTATLSTYFDSAGITKREAEVILFILMGFSNKQIGDKLFISLSTVKKHVYSIFRKINVKSRMALTVLIREKAGQDLLQ
jgi:DNA-binding CsgD family transcriptional regulator